MGAARGRVTADEVGGAVLRLLTLESLSLLSSSLLLLLLLLSLSAPLADGAAERVLGAAGGG